MKLSAVFLLSVACLLGVAVTSIMAYGYGIKGGGVGGIGGYGGGYSYMPVPYYGYGGGSSSGGGFGNGGFRKFFLV